MLTVTDRQEHTMYKEKLHNLNLEKYNNVPTCRFHNVFIYVFVIKFFECVVCVIKRFTSLNAISLLKRIYGVTPIFIVDHKRPPNKIKLFL